MTGDPEGERGDGQVAVGRQSLGLQDDTSVDEVSGGVPGGSLVGAGERVPSSTPLEEWRRTHA